MDVAEAWARTKAKFIDPKCLCGKFTSAVILQPLGYEEDIIKKKDSRDLLWLNMAIPLPLN